MKKTIKKLLSVFFATILLLSATPLGLFQIESFAFDQPYENGDIIEFGSYPQSEVTNSALLKELNSLPKTWISYKYYSGDGTVGSMTAGDFMMYADVSYNGNMYRAVTFSAYRPYYSYYPSSPLYTYQDEYGYMINTVYWFKYEPLKWRVLDIDTGLIISEYIIDTQAYCEAIYYNSTNGEYYKDSAFTTYCNNYAKSDIRKWLNNDFYNTAFSIKERDSIKNSTLDNKAYSISYWQYDSAVTSDNIFLLSHSDAYNLDYFSNNTTKLAFGSDYAKCQGLYVNSTNNASYWYLRTAGNFSDLACRVNYNGEVYDSYSSNVIYYPGIGIRPALKLENVPVSVSLQKAPAKSEYIYKQDEVDLSGIELFVTYFDGTTKTITDTSKMIVSGFSNTTRGEQTVTVDFEGVQAEFKVNVKYTWWQWLIVILLFGWIWY